MKFFHFLPPIMLPAVVFLSAGAAQFAYGDVPAKPDHAEGDATGSAGSAARVKAAPVSIDIDEDSRQPTPRTWLYQAEKIVGTPVTNSSGERLGKLDELVVDARSGKIRYAAVAVPSVLRGGKLIAVPWGSLQARHQDGKLVVEFDVPPQKLQMAPGFDREKWPDVGNRQFAERVDVYFGLVVKEGDLKSKFGTDVGALAEASHLWRASQLSKVPVQTADHSQTGKIESVVVDLKRREIRYAVVGFPTVMNLRDRLFPMPWTHIKFETEDDEVRFVLNPRADASPPSPHFSRNSWPDLRDPRWAEMVDRFYGDDKGGGDKNEGRKNDDATDGDNSE